MDRPTWRHLDNDDHLLSLNCVTVCLDFFRNFYLVMVIVWLIVWVLWASCNWHFALPNNWNFALYRVCGKPILWVGKDPVPVPAVEQLQKRMLVKSMQSESSTAMRAGRIWSASNKCFRSHRVINCGDIFVFFTYQIPKCQFYLLSKV